MLDTGKSRERKERRREMSRQKRIDPAAPYQPINAAAALTGLSRYYILNGCKDGTIPHIRVGVDYRVNMPMFLDQLQKASEAAI